MPGMFDPRKAQKRADDAAKKAKRGANKEGAGASSRIQKWARGVKGL